MFGGAQGGNEGDPGGGAGWAARAGITPTAAAQPSVQGVAARDDGLFWPQFRNAVKKPSCNFFEYHRRGLSRDPAAPWADADIPPLFREPAAPPPQNLPLFGRPPPPPPPRWDRRYGPDYDARAAISAQVRAREGYERFAAGHGGMVGQRAADARASAEAVRRNLAALGATVRLVKLLGVGGNGVAGLFEVWPGGQGGPSRKVVVKSLLKKGPNMVTEQYWNRALKRAPHIIQPRSWGREIMPTEGMGDAALQALRDTWSPIDNDITILTLEFMKGGDLHNFIKKLAWQGDVVPQAVLWRIFFCLVRGCISMYSPPRSLVDGYVMPAQNWIDEFGPDLDEALPGPEYGSASDRPEAGWNFVHYDLDPQNVLIGDTDGRDHTFAPIFKISDLGLGKTMDEPMFTRPLDIWFWRRMGKPSYLLPEQHHKEWDYIQTIPNLEDHKVAGRYGEWSNIFQMGLCMQTLITRAIPPYPPIAIGPLNGPPGGPDLFDEPTVIRDSGGTPVAPFHTHGFNIALEPGVGDDLAHLLMRCLADLPADRPPLAELEWLMNRMEREGRLAVDPADDPGGVVGWCDRAFNQPARPPATAEEVSSTAFVTAPSTMPRPEMFATAPEAAGASQQGGGVGNDRVPLPLATPWIPGAWPDSTSAGVAAAQQQGPPPVPYVIPWIPGAWPDSVTGRTDSSGGLFVTAPSGGDSFVFSNGGSSRGFPVINYSESTSGFPVINYSSDSRRG